MTGCTVNGVNQTNYEHDYSIERVLNKITFPEGTVNFFYENGRLDLRGGKLLKKIEVRNNNSELIKGVLFEQDYFNANGCTDQQCYRLKLNAIKFYDNLNNILPGYSFEYNSLPLPRRYSLNQDFLGFYNGDHGINQKDYVPKLYYKSNQQKNTYIPFPLPEESYQLICGNASLTPILNYAKAGSLEKITYPTGGYSIFDYQLNSFKFLGHDIQGGGLRILSQSLYENNSLRKKLLYNYDNEDGTTSGQINNLPNFTNYVLLPGYFSLIALSRYQNINNRLEITGSSNIGYSRFRIDEQNNGYIVNNYTNISEYPNLYPGNFIFPIDPASLSSTFTANLNTIVNEGTAPNIYQNMDEKRGKLKSSFIFDKNNNLLKSVTNNYSNFLYDIIEEKQPVICGPEPYNNYVFHDNPHVIYKSDLASENFFLTNSITDEKVSGYSGYVRRENNFLYNANKPFLIEKQITVNNADLIKEKIFYPYDPEVSSLPNMSTLNDRNILLPVKTMKYKNNKLLFTNLTSFSTFNGNYIFPNLVSDAISNNQLEPKYIFTQYDNLGNILEQQKANDVKEVNLWGYNSSHLVAKIIGTTYDIAKTYITQNILDAPANDGALRIHLNNLRSIPGALVTTYTYKPLVGITSQTDPNNKTTYYEYDAFNRLALIRDHDNSILKKICYNYAGQTENCTYYYNTQQSAAFTKTCPVGQQSSSVTFTISANAFSSTVSVIDANNMAIAYMNANGPAYANQYAACTAIACTGIDKKIINGICETGILGEISTVRSGTNCITKWGYFFSDGTYVYAYSTTTPTQGGGCI